MKNFKNHLFLIVSVTLLVFNSCNKEDGPEADIPGSPIITGFGEPISQANEVTIGPEGGTINSSDGLLSVSIPQGALSGSTSISIQAITNQAPLGLGNGYRLGPEGINFNSPVTLTFHYSEDLLDSKPAEFLWIVFQESDGTWDGMLKSALNTDSKTVTVETLHFSDWSLGIFADLTLNPVSKAVQKGEPVELTITGFSNRPTLILDDKTIKLVLTAGQTDIVWLKFIGSVALNWRVVEWTLNGVKAPVSNNFGNLRYTENTASYTAPTTVPKPNVVSVTVELETNSDGSKTTFYLTSKITIYENNFFVSVDFRGETYVFYQYGFDESEIADPANYSYATCGLSENRLEMGGATFVNFEVKEAFQFYFDKPAKGSRGMIGLGDGGNDEMNFMVINPYAYYDIREEIRTRSGDYCNQNINESNLVEMTLSDFSGTLFSEVEGSFTGRLFYSEQTYDSECKSSIPYPVSGKFHMMMLTSSK